MAFEYIVNGKRVKLPVNPDKIAVRFRDSADKAGRKAVIDSKPEVGTFEDRFEVPNEMRWSSFFRQKTVFHFLHF